MTQDNDKIRRMEVTRKRDQKENEELIKSLVIASTAIRDAIVNINDPLDSGVNGDLISHLSKIGIMINDVATNIIDESIWVNTLDEADCHLYCLLIKGPSGNLSDGSSVYVASRLNLDDYEDWRDLIDDLYKADSISKTQYRDVALLRRASYREVEEHEDNGQAVVSLVDPRQFMD